MKKILLLCLVLWHTIVFAQKQTSIKIYQNTDIFQTVVNEWWRNQITEVDVRNFNRFSVALQYKFRLTHEVEIFIPEISKPVEDLQFPINAEIRKDPRIKGTASSFSFRYELSKRITKEQNAFQVSVGAGVNPYYLKMEYTPTVTDVYPSSTELYGTCLNLIPRISYDITDRFSLDLNIPIKVFDYRFEKTHIRNPAIPIRQQINHFAKSIFFEQAYTIRLGVAYGLGYRQR